MRFFTLCKTHRDTSFPHEQGCSAGIPIVTEAAISGLFSAAVPLDRAAQAFFEIDAWSVAQASFRHGNIRQRMFDVTAARRTVLHLAGIARQRLQCLERFIQRDAAAPSPR